MSINPLSSLPVPAVKPAQPAKVERFDRWWIMVAVVVVLLVLLIFLKPDPYQNLFMFVRDGVWRTIYITIISFALVAVFGLIVALLRLSKHKLIRGIGTVYVEIIRGIPMLVQIIYWYFAFPAIVQELGRSFNIPSFMNFPPGWDCDGHFWFDLWLLGLHERSLSRWHPKHLERPDGSRPQSGHDLCGCHALRHPAASRTRGFAADG